MSFQTDGKKCVQFAMVPCYGAQAPHGTASLSRPSDSDGIGRMRRDDEVCSARKERGSWREERNSCLKRASYSEAMI